MWKQIRKCTWRHQMKYFPRYWSFVRGIHRSPMNSPHKGQWRGVLMFSFICTWINGCVNNHEAGDLRHHCAHYDVFVMSQEINGLPTSWPLLDIFRMETWYACSVYSGYSIFSQASMVVAEVLTPIWRQDIRQQPTWRHTSVDIYPLSPKNAPMYNNAEVHFILIFLS